SACRRAATSHPGPSRALSRLDRIRSRTVNLVDLHVNIEGERDLAKQIFEQVRSAILAGRLAPGERLPPTRELARRLEVSRNTDSLAYERLTAQGLVAGRAGAGSFVDAKVLADAQRRSSPAVSRLESRPLWRQIPRDFGKIPPGS